MEGVAAEVKREWPLERVLRAASFDITGLGRCPTHGPDFEPRFLDSHRGNGGHEGRRANFYSLLRLDRSSPLTPLLSPLPFSTRYSAHWILISSVIPRLQTVAFEIVLLRCLITSSTHKDITYIYFIFFSTLLLREEILPNSQLIN